MNIPIKNRRKSGEICDVTIKKRSFFVDKELVRQYNKAMVYTEREQSILDILKNTSSVDVKTLTRVLYTSEATVRRDLRKLEQKGLIIRSHGKAMRNSVYADRNVGFDLREHLLSPVKKNLAKTAVELFVAAGSVVMLDASSTAMCAVEYLAEKKDVIIITNGLKSLGLLAQTELKFFSTGGMAMNKSASFVGQTAIAAVNSFNADVAIVSCHGLSEDGFATDTSIPENDVRLAMLNRAKRKILIIDSSKINSGFWHNLCHISLFDDVVCDRELPEHLLPAVKNFCLVK